MGMKGKVGGLIIILGLLGMIGFPIAQYFIVSVQADVAYGNAFGGDVTMVYDQADFMGIKDQINVIWTKMNETWPCIDPKCSNQKTIYNSYWQWDKTIDNSIYQENLYFKNLINRLNGYQKQWEQVQSGAVVYTTFDFQKAMDGLRTDMKSEGGIDWAIRGAYYLQFYPSAYFAAYYNIAVWVVGVIMMVAGWAILDSDHSY